MNVAEVLAANTTYCRAPGCRSKVEKRKGHQLCEMHYSRLRRRGELEPKKYGAPDWTRRLDQHGYVKIKVPLGHPAHDDLRCSHGRYVLEHRYVAWETYRHGPTDCHWCGEAHTWDTIHVDHLNHERHDNRPANLVLSCRSCNTARTKDRDPEKFAFRVARKRLVLRHAEELRAEMDDVLRSIPNV